MGLLSTVPLSRPEARQVGCRLDLAWHLTRQCFCANAVPEQQQAAAAAPTLTVGQEPALTTMPPPLAAGQLGLPPDTAATYAIPQNAYYQVRLAGPRPKAVHAWWCGRAVPRCSDDCAARTHSGCPCSGLMLLSLAPCSRCRASSTTPCRRLARTTRRPPRHTKSRKPPLGPLGGSSWAVAWCWGLSCPRCVQRVARALDTHGTRHAANGTCFRRVGRAPRMAAWDMDSCGARPGAWQGQKVLGASRRAVCAACACTPAYTHMQARPRRLPPPPPAPAWSQDGAVRVEPAAAACAFRVMTHALAALVSAAGPCRCRSS